MYVLFTCLMQKIIIGIHPVGKGFLFICRVLFCVLPHTIVFLSTDEVMQTTYCEIELDREKRDAFVYAIKNHYWYQMYIDDLPIWGE